MKNKVSFFERISSGKGFYITASICICVIIAAIAVIYNSSVNMLKGVVTPETTAQVQKNQQGEKDPRVTQRTTKREEITTTKKDEPTTERTTNEPSTVITTAPTTKPSFEKSTAFVTPVSGEILKGFSTSPIFDETMEDWRSHGGTDYEVSENDEVKAVGNGIVSKVVSDPNWGYIVELDCGDFTARYCGLLQGTTVSLNTVLSQGDVVGKIGNIPCESAQEKHLHLEIIKDGDRVDPKSVLN